MTLMRMRCDEHFPNLEKWLKVYITAALFWLFIQVIPQFFAAAVKNRYPRHTLVCHTRRLLSLVIVFFAFTGPSQFWPVQNPEECLCTCVAATLHARLGGGQWVHDNFLLCMAIRHWHLTTLALVAGLTLVSCSIWGAWPVFEAGMSLYLDHGK